MSLQLQVSVASVRVPLECPFRVIVSPLHVHAKTQVWTQQKKKDDDEGREIQGNIHLKLTGIIDAVMII